MKQLKDILSQAARGNVESWEKEERRLDRIEEKVIRTQERLDSISLWCP